MQQTYSGTSELADDLSIGGIEAQLYAMATATKREMARDAEARIDRHLAACGRSQVELIALVQRIRRSISDVEQPEIRPELAVAALGVPHRVTKRDYNYFDALHAALSALSVKERSAEYGAG
jgi:hypothetical protein